MKSSKLFIAELKLEILPLFFGATLEHFKYIFPFLKNRLNGSSLPFSS